MSLNRKEADGSTTQVAGIPYVTKENIGLGKVENKSPEELVAMSIAAYNDTSMYANAVAYGMVAGDDSETVANNNKTILQNLINAKKNIYIPAGRYYLSKGEVDVCQPISIVGDNKLTLDGKIGTCLYGAQVKITDNAILKNMEIRAAVDANGNATSCVAIHNRCFLEDIGTGFSTVGFDMSNMEASIAYVFLVNCLAGYCTDAGYKIVHSNTKAQKNVIRLEGCTATSAGGNDGRDYTKPATLTSGYGFYIDGGYAITLYNCCSQFNSGTGIYVKGGKSTTGGGRGDILSGLTINGCYLESNKHAHIVVDTSEAEGFFGNIDISGNFYVDNDAVTQVEGFEPIRGVVVKDGVDLLLCNDGEHNNKWSSHVFNIDGIDFRSSGENACNRLPMRMLESVYRYSHVLDRKNLVDDNGVVAIEFTDALPYFRLGKIVRAYGMSNGHVYRISFKYKKTAGSTDVKAQLRINHANGTSIKTETVQIGTDTSSEYKEYTTFYYVETDEKYIEFNIVFQNIDSAFKCNVAKFEVYEVDSSYGSRFPSFIPAGHVFLHTGLGIAYTYDGTKWRDLMGNVYPFD